MAETNYWCTMIVTLFYILCFIYLMQIFFIKDFDPIGKEFANTVILGIIALLQKK